VLSTWEQIGVGALLYFLLGGKSKAATATQERAVDGELLRRANQGHASDPWFAIFTQDSHPPLDHDIAAAVCRWIGIESSGDPTAVSSSGERGLVQITKTSALTEGALTQAEWDAMISPTTSPQENARIAWKIIEWCWDRAKKYVAGGVAKDAIDQIWYAKLYHQRPVDVRDGKLTGDAAADSRRLEKTWSGDPMRLRYLHAANVVAWNSLTPP
jgi:hypothetical protein